MTVIEKSVYLWISSIYIIIYILLTLFFLKFKKLSSVITVIGHSIFLHFFTAKGILFGNYFVFLHRLCPRFGGRAVARHIGISDTDALLKHKSI